MQVIHHGGKHTVTGSCHELSYGTQALLIAVFFRDLTHVH